MKKVKTTIKYTIEMYDAENIFKNLTLEEVKKLKLRNMESYERNIKSSLDNMF